MRTVSQILTDIKNGKLYPVYFLMGEEPYFIDTIAQCIENDVLSDTEKEFNQVILYGKDTDIDSIISAAKRYPMMAEKQVVIIKEAQHLSRTIDNLADYVNQPQPSTVLVICYKYKTIDKRKKLAKILNKSGLLFESKKLYDNQMGDWIRQELAANNYRIEPKAASLLVEFLGTDLSKVVNELNKLRLILPEGTEILATHIEENIGISKDFNNFELRKAIGERQVVKANQIINYFAQNPKHNPLVVTISLLFSFFSQLLIYHSLKDKSKRNVASALRVNPYFVQDYQRAARNYPMKKVSQNISYLREADLKSKGVGANNMSQHDILKELIFKVMH